MIVLEENKNSFIDFTFDKGTSKATIDYIQSSKRGDGTKLLNGLIKAINPKMIVAEVSAANTEAKRFFKKHKFRIAEEDNSILWFVKQLKKGRR